MASNAQSDVPTGTTGTPSIADSLRQAADWLDAHPELAARSASVQVRSETREDLETLARALGDRAQEREAYGDVIVEGFLAGEHYSASIPYVVVRGDVSIAKLGGEAPVKPTYRPILSEFKSSAPFTDAELDAAVEPHVDDQDYEIGES